MKLFNVYPLYDIEPVQGKGCYIIDNQGIEYLDLYGGHAVISIGHNHPHYIQSIENQLHKLGFYSNAIQNPLQQQLADTLGKLSGLGDEYQLFLCNSGAEANENALKMASFRTGKTRVLAFEKAFHGRTSAAVNATHDAKIQAPINQTFPVDFLPWNDLQRVELELAKGDVCAVLIEGIQGIGGIYVPEVAFLEGIAAACTATETPLILDEIQSGYGRSGRFFAFQYAAIQPDMITMAKGMGNGFPIGGVLIRNDYEAKFGLLGTTFGGNHLACAAAIAVLEVIENEQLIENARAMGDYFMQQLQMLPNLKEIRGQGLMIGIELEENTAALRKKLLFEQKIFVGSASNPNVIRLLPPLTIGKREIDVFIKKFHLCTSHFPLLKSTPSCLMQGR
jgi:acetylornithine/N-succinyldiaminopimelate aminotransferase